MTSAITDDGAIEVLPPGLAGPYAYMNRCVRLRATHRRRVRGSELLGRDPLTEVLERYAAGFPGCDRRAIVSVWSDHYFACLIPPIIAASCFRGRAIPAALDEIDALFAEDGRPVGFSVGSVGRAAGGDVFTRSTALIRGHVEPLIGALARHAGVSRRLLWANAGVRVAGVAALGAVLPSPFAAEAVRTLLRSPSWPDGSENHLFGTVRPDAGGRIAPGRRVCCLAYTLPGFSTCPGCPLPDSKRQPAEPATVSVAGDLAHATGDGR